MADIRNDSAFARSLRELRVSRGASLQEVAAAIGTSRSHIWQLETGRRPNPSLDVLKKLASYYRVTIGRLIGEEAHVQAAQRGLVRLVERFSRMTQEEQELYLRMAEAVGRPLPPHVAEPGADAAKEPTAAH